MKNAAYLLTVLLLVVGSVTASAPDGGIQSPFSLGAGARELALGGTGVAAADATTAAYWNASRLANTEHLSVSAFHCRLFDSDVAYQYFGLSVPTLDFGSFGLGVFRLGISGIEQRDVNNLVLDEINDDRIGVYFAYGRKLSGYDVGLAVSMENHSLGDYSATSTPGVSLSIGRTLRSRHGYLSDVYVSLSARNLIAPSMELVQEKVSDPTVGDFGLSAVLLPSRSWEQSLTLSAVVSKAESVDADFSLGLEYSFRQLLFVRGGVRDDRMSFGAGLKYSLISFDYALVDRDLGSVHMFSITSDFGRSVTERKALRQQKREAEFARMMEEQILRQNKSTMNDLLAQGEAMLREGELAEGVRLLDRALFFARTSGADTAEISSLIDSSRMRLESIERDESFLSLMDSANVAYGRGQYLVSRLLVLQAVGLRPDSDDAGQLLRKVDLAIERAENREEMISTQLWLADSLASYGQYDEALRVLESLGEFATGDKKVGQALRKVSFEKECAAATADFESRRFGPAVAHLDSALAILPGHGWCLGLKARIEKEHRRSIQPSRAPIEASTRVALSESQLKQLDRSYQQGQKLFAAGKLEAAVTEWEKVLSVDDEYLSVREYLVKAYKFIGVDLYGQNRLDEAIDCWQKAMVLEPGNEEISGYISRAQNEIRNLKELSYDVAN